MKMLKGRNVLITGSTGFVGANLVRRAIKSGSDIYIFTRATSNKWRITDVLKDVNEYCIDLLDYKKLERIILTIKPEIIFHTAIYGGYPFQKDIKKIIDTNFIGTVNLLNACKKAGFELFVNTGSSSEYGIKSKPPREEDLLEPINDYGVSKAAATLYCQTVARRDKIPIVTLRLFSPYGYYEEPTRLIPSVIMSCLAGKNPKVTSPNYVRDFIFVEDVIDVYMKVIEISEISGEIFNIGYGKQQSVGEVVDRIVKLTGDKVKPDWGLAPRWQNEPNKWQANISKTKAILKWTPKYNLEAGLAKSIKWFEKNMSLYSGLRNGDPV